MYEQHFGLHEAPFRVTPDTDYYFAHRHHQEALNVLLFGVSNGEGFIKVSGEVGTGKTLLCRKLLKLAEGRFVTAWIPNPALEPTALAEALAEELGTQAPRALGQHRQLKQIYQRLVRIADAGGHTLVCIDEAQAMPDETLEALRLLSNLEAEKRKLMTVVLFGQPELDQRLATQGLRQLRNRIGLAYRLRPLDRGAVEQYVVHRLRIAGAPRADTLFRPRALRALHRASRGLPRLINILAHKSLLAAFGRQQAVVDRDHVRRAAADTEDANAVSRLEWSDWAALTLPASALILVAVARILLERA